MSFATRPRFDSYAARWRDTALAKFLGIGWGARARGDAAKAAAATRTRWREKSLALREAVRRARLQNASDASADKSRRRRATELMSSRLVQ
jgi:hypothetical protein